MRLGNNDQPLVSVIMPVYNCEKYVGQAIESIMNQTYTNWELLICDDGSNDRSAEIVNAYRGKDSRIILEGNETNKGIVVSTNRLFYMSKGDYIMLQDSDDWSHENRISKLLYEFEKVSPDIGIIGSAIIRYFINRSERQNFPSFIDKLYLINNIGKKIPMKSPSIMFKRSLLNTIGVYRNFFNNIGAADYDFIYRASFKYNIINVSEPLYYVRQNTSSFTRSFSINPLKYCSAIIAEELFLERDKKGADKLEEKGNEYYNYVKLKHRIDSSFSYFSYSDQLIHSKNYFKALKYGIIALLINFSWRNIKNCTYIISLIVKDYIKRIYGYQ